MKVRVLSMVLSLAALFWAGPIQAQTGNVKPDDDVEFRRSAVEAEQQLAKQFSDFQKSLQSLKNRLDRSSDSKDKNRAIQLQKVLDKADSAGIRIQFTRLQEHLRKDKFGLDELKEAALKTSILAKDFKELLDLFEGRNDMLGEEISQTQKAIKALEDIIKTQKQLQLITEQGNTDKNPLAKQQENTIQDTKDLKKSLTGKTDPKETKEPKTSGGETKDMKSQPKEGKGDDKKAESKDAGKQNQGEAKDSGPKDSKDKAGEPKAKGAEGAEKKPGTPDPKAGEKKDSKGAETKEASAKDSKGSKGAQAEPKDAKGSEAKQGDSKDAGKKDGAPPKAKEAGEAKGKQEPKTEAKQGEPKAKEKGNEDNKAGAKDAKNSPDAKQADAKDAGKDSKQAEAKAGDPKAGQKSSAKGQPMDPKDGGDPPQAKGDKGSPPPPPQAGNEKDPPGGPKKIQDAIDKMKEAKKDIEDGKNGPASDKQEDAIQKLEEAKKELEKRLKILREEELERLLTNLKTRLERMLAIEKDILNNSIDGTVATYQAVQLNSDKKPADAQVQAALRNAAKQKDNINEATKTIEILEGEGSAVAFPVAMQQVREDMKTAHRRLDGADVGLITQQIEKDIIESLEDMIKAVDKKKEEMDKEKAKPKPPQEPKESGPPPDQKLLDQIAELKLIRSMQIQLNKRTELYSKQFPGQEQLPPNADANLRREIGELRDRQDRIYDITNKIQKGDNK